MCASKDKSETDRAQFNLAGFMLLAAHRFLFAVAGLACFVCAAGDSLLPPPPNEVTKVVRQYALTSANDFPQRDPRDWRLLGSNDGGTNWTTLDVRKGELFLERHQRRLFKLGRWDAFNLYRLQIDEVRDAASANSVHLAEIEPLGDNEDDLDPIPSFQDRLTVRGENPPLESGFQAFDGRPETKWLDFANQNPATRSSWIQWQYVRQSGLVVTSVQQLLLLRARANESYPVKINAVLANRLTRTKVVCLLDATGYLEIPFEEELTFTPGQRVLLEGTSVWRNKQVEIAHCKFTLEGRSLASVPRHIALEQPLGPEDELQWVETEGTVQFRGRSDNHLMFELEDGPRRLEVKVLHVESSDHPPPKGSRIRVSGICEASLNLHGQKVAGTLWVPSLEDLSILPTTHPNETIAGPVDSSNKTSRVSTTIRELLQLSRADLAHGPRVKVKGVTTELFGNYIQDASAGIELWMGSGPSQRTETPTLGTYVEVTGSGDWIEGHGPVIRVETLAVLGKGNLPKPERPSWAQLTSGRMMNQWVEVEGVVRSTDGSHLLLMAEGGAIMATIRSAPATQVQALVDATVRLRGLDIMATDDRGQFQGIQLVVPSLEQVEVERAAPDPFALPARPIGSLFRVSRPKEFSHRVKVEGVLTFREEGRFFLHDSSGAAMAIGREEVILDSPPGPYHWAFVQAPDSRRTQRGNWEFKPGDRVQAVGFPESRGGNSPVLTEVLMRKIGQGASLPPVKAAVSDILLGKYDSALVSLEAELLARENFGAHHVFQMQAEQVRFQVVTPAAGANAPVEAPGSRLLVTGVCQVEPSPFPELGKHITSFKILVGTADGLLVLERPSWWTLKHALAVAATLLVSLVFAGGWIGILRRQVEVRTAQLTREIEERKRIEAEMELGHKKLLHTSRMVGMADVATSVLHNVGNVLNSANMLVALIGNQLRGSKVSTLVKAVSLMGEHRNDLGRFLSEDERGRHLPTLLERLAEHLASERNRLQDKVDALTESVQHIKDVVTRQQKYAKVSTMTETVSLAEVVEDALRLSGGALAEHRIQVVRQYEQTPALTIDRHKVLQILFNVLENAKRACIECGLPDREVKIQIRPTEEGGVRIRVQDNGVGIAPENLSRIFAQYFSTRSDGHGFGLHSSMLAAQDMGGSLTAHSDGLGSGAAVTLQLCRRPS